MAEYLEHSVASLGETVVLLQKTIDGLKKDSEPNNNLVQTILQSKRVFELISEYDVERAKLAQSEEIDPLVKTLEDKLGKSLGKLKRELDTLQQTYELNKLRLNNSTNGKNGDASDTSFIADVDVSTDVVVMASSTNEELQELKELKLKRKLLQKKLQELKVQQ